MKPFVDNEPNLICDLEVEESCARELDRLGIQPHNVDTSTLEAITAHVKRSIEEKKSVVVLEREAAASAVIAAPPPPSYDGGVLIAKEDEDKRVHIHRNICRHRHYAFTGGHSDDSCSNFSSSPAVLTAPLAHSHGWGWRQLFPGRTDKHARFKCVSSSDKAGSGTSAPAVVAGALAATEVKEKDKMIDDALTQVLLRYPRLEEHLGILRDLIESCDFDVCVACAQLQELRVLPEENDEKQKEKCSVSSKTNDVRIPDVQQDEVKKENDDYQRKYAYLGRTFTADRIKKQISANFSNLPRALSSGCGKRDEIPFCTVAELDFHGLHRKEAIDLFRKQVKALQSMPTMRGERLIRVIAGRGNHSVNGPVLFPAFIRELQASLADPGNDIKYFQESNGYIDVVLRSPS